MAPFCDVTRCKAIRRATNEFITDMERHLTEIGLPGMTSSEVLRHKGSYHIGYQDNA